ncbi:MAG: Dam family site-specific DNA-(adenine-N6)-methyltransferase [Defluviitaleaceae bacterium]|nr:Dam family site-specific DNA-(adenine-N6)-methyltransferase [Defluviitaleaceae bacterium]
MGKIYIPPFKIQGIKTKLVPLIKANILIDDDTIWIEPFMGSGVVGLNVAGTNAIFADTNPHIINFYNQLKSETITSGLVRDYLGEQGSLLSLKGDEHYYLVRERFNEAHDPLDFLFLNRSCFNGMMRFNKNKGYNVPFGHKPNRFAKAYITKIVNQVKHFEHKLKNNNWTFLCQSFEETIALVGPNSFIYCDPPYIGRHVDYYNSWDEEQELKLHARLISSRANFMVSSWGGNIHRSNPYLNTIWNDCNRIYREHFYFVGASEANRNPMTEVLLTNYAPINVASEQQLDMEQLEFAF